MIYCPQCGSPNFDDANYCDHCGEPLIKEEDVRRKQAAAEAAYREEADRMRREHQAYQRAYRRAQKQAKRAAKTAGGTASSKKNGKKAKKASAAQQSQNPYQGTQFEQATSYQAGTGSGQGNGSGSGNANGGGPIPAVTYDSDVAVYRHGCLAQAWDDITESKGWGKKITILGLINIVPILNFFVSGYAMKWGSQLPRDEVLPMPNKVMGDGMFVSGFYAFVMMLVVGIVNSIAASILNLIPVLGIILSIALYLLLVMFQYMSIMRVAIWNNLGKGFSVSTIFKHIFTGNFGALFCATVLPSIIIWASISFITLALVAIFALPSINELMTGIQYAQMGNSLYGMNGYGSSMMDPFDMMFGFNPMMSMYSSMAPAMIQGAIMALVPIMVIIYFITAFLQALNYVLTMRATGHFVARFCRDWTTS